MQSDGSANRPAPNADRKRRREDERTTPDANGANYNRLTNTGTQATKIPASKKQKTNAWKAATVGAAFVATLLYATIPADTTGMDVPDAGLSWILQARPLKSNSKLDPKHLHLIDLIHFQKKTHSEVRVIFIQKGWEKSAKTD